MPPNFVLSKKSPTYYKVNINLSQLPTFIYYKNR